MSDEKAADARRPLLRGGGPGDAAVRKNNFSGRSCIRAWTTSTGCD
jgi:hypothetical protein